MLYSEMTWTAAGDRDHKMHWPLKTLDDLDMSAIALDCPYKYEIVKDGKQDQIFCNLLMASDEYAGKNGYVKFRKPKSTSKHRVMEIQTKHLECTPFEHRICRVQRDPESGDIRITLPKAIQLVATRFIKKRVPEKAAQKTRIDTVRGKEVDIMAVPLSDPRFGPDATRRRKQATEDQPLSDDDNGTVQTMVEFLQSRELMDSFASYWLGRNSDCDYSMFVEAWERLQKAIY